MSEPIYEALLAARTGKPESAPSEAASAGDLVSELEAAASFADGTRRGLLVPLADFTRHRIAKALRDAAAALRAKIAPPVTPEGHVLDRVESVIGAVLTEHGIDPSVRVTWRDESVARVAARHALGQALQRSVDPRNNGIERFASERARHIHEEDHDPEDDIGHSDELIAASGCFLQAAALGRDAWHEPDGTLVPPGGWPWPAAAWKPSADRGRNIEIAGDLAAAAYDAHKAEIALAQNTAAPRTKRLARFT